MEISRCTQQQDKIQDPIEIVILATNKYNHSIHSVIDAKPIDILQNCPPAKFGEVKSKLIKEQEKMLNFFNKNKITKNYKPGEKVFVRRNKRLGDKFQKVFIEKIIQQDLGTTVLIDGKKIHKSNLR